MSDDVLLEVEGLTVRLGRERNLVVDGLSFTLRAGERAALLGPSGCGKTTTLRAIAGFERADAGRVRFEGKVLSEGGRHVPPHLRRMGMVFQEFALFPHLNVGENVAFGLDRLPRQERDARCAEMLRLVGLEGFEERHPGQLSGGQQQRVALARALAPKPSLLLLDEPFSSLDAGLRRSTRNHTEQVLASVGAAALLVTHDQDEAMAFAERLIVMNRGRIEQSGSPETLYRAPRNAFVATFLGAANILRGEAEGRRARTPLGPVPLESELSGPVQLCLRPEALRLVPSGAVGCEIRTREFRGSSTLFQVEGEGFAVSVLCPGDAPWRAGETAAVEVVSPAAVLEDRA